MKNRKEIENMIGYLKEDISTLKKQSDEKPCIYLKKQIDILEWVLDIEKECNHDFITKFGLEWCQKCGIVQ